MNMEHTCLADFAANFRYTASKPAPSVKNTNDSENMPKGSFIRLQKDKGFMTQRTTAAIVRSHQWSLQKQREQYFHALLLLYYPWRHEMDDLKISSYEDSYKRKMAVIQSNQLLFEKNAEEVAEALENMEQMQNLEETCNVLAPQTQQTVAVDSQTGVQEPTNSIMHAFEPTHNTTMSDIGVAPHEVEFLTEKMSNSEWYEHIYSLNDAQSKFHQFIVRWCSEMILSHVSVPPQPFHIFLTGGAGVGKSYLLRAIVQTANRLLQRNNQVDEARVLVCAPTGAAAYNVSGYTIHSSFHLPLHTRSSDDYIPLSGEKLAAVKEAIGSVKIVIIDEMLLTIHRRLTDVMCNDEPFGGLSIIAVGDLLQLPPVAQKQVFSLPSDELTSIYGSLWQNNFQMYELTEIQRQKGDGQFADLLNRVRCGT
jgi:ATP-dependent DNA helicase PIF1